METNRRRSASALAPPGTFAKAPPAEDPCSTSDHGFMRRSLIARLNTIKDTLETYFLFRKPYSISYLRARNRSGGGGTKLDERREPSCESKSFAAISSELSSFVEFDKSDFVKELVVKQEERKKGNDHEPKVEPTCQPTELNKDIRRLITNQTSNVRYSYV